MRSKRFFRVLEEWLVASIDNKSLKRSIRVMVIANSFKSLCSGEQGDRLGGVEIVLVARLL